MENTASEVHVRRFKEKEVGIPTVGEQFIFPCAGGSIKSVDDGPNHDTSIPSRSYPDPVVDISACLPGEETDGSNLAREGKRRYGSESCFREVLQEASFRRQVMRREMDVLGKNHVLFQ